MAPQEAITIYQIVSSWILFKLKDFIRVKVWRGKRFFLGEEMDVAG